MLPAISKLTRQLYELREINLRLGWRVSPAKHPGLIVEGCLNRWSKINEDKHGKNWLFHELMSDIEQAQLEAAEEYLMLMALADACGINATFVLRSKNE